MLHNTPFIQSFMARYDYPKPAAELFTRLLKKLDSNPVYGKTFDDLRDKFLSGRAKLDNDILFPLAVLGRAMGCHPYSIHFVFLLSLTEDLRRQYALLGIDEKIYYDTMADLKCKLMECINVKGVAGSFSHGWPEGFFRMKRIALGRFQYEVGEYGAEEYKMSCGRVLKKGDVVVGFHIPSTGVPLTDDVRLESYKQAYNHFKPLFPDGRVIFCCGSWLLYPKHREFLPEDMNIRHFLDDFEIVSWSERSDFHDGWRIFGKDAKKKPSKLPRDTRLKKAYAEWLEAGNKAGNGFGVFAFDGKKIVR